MRCAPRLLPIVFTWGCVFSPPSSGPISGSADLDSGPINGIVDLGSGPSDGMVDLDSGTINGMVDLGSGPSDGGIADPTDTGPTDFGRPMDAGIRDADASLEDFGLDTGFDLGGPDLGTTDLGQDMGVFDQGVDAGMSVCGDSIVQLLSGELCDDGNRQGGDGCDPTCQPEPGFLCFGQPSLCATPGQIIRVPSQEPTIADAFDEIPTGNRRLVVLDSANYGGMEPPLTVEDFNVIIVGDGPMPTISSNLDGPGITVVANGTLVLVNVRLTTTGAADEGVRLEDATAQLVMRSARIENTRSEAIIAVNDSVVQMEYSVIENTSGVFLDTPFFKIENSFFLSNTSPGQHNVGGVRFEKSPDSSSFFRFNSVLDNSTNGGTGDGVHCSSQNTTLFGVLVWDNGNNNQNGCDFRFSNVEDLAPAGSNISADCNLDGNHRLTPNSPCINAAGLMGPVLDFDFQPRVPPFDIGADEYAP